MTKLGVSGPLRRLAALALVATVAAASTPVRGDSADQNQTSAKPGILTLEQWTPWRDRFVAADGRIADDANKNISHSEGQGYGLLLSVLARDSATFARIWGFTKKELLLRDDGLAVWRWDPDSNPHVTDTNDASDGDILIAYSLALAGETWNSPEFTMAARDLATAIGKLLVKRVGGWSVLMPAVKGYGAGERPDGPVINLSYWIFEAFPILAQLAPDTNWTSLSDSGREILITSRFGPPRLPSNWISLHAAAPAPALGFDRLFGYDAIRIPLYLLRAGIVDRSLLGPFAKSWGSTEEGPRVVSVDDGRAANDLADPGYRMIAAALACVLDHKPIPASLKTAAPTSYYPSTLYLLALSTVAQNHLDCL
jgi:endo-1,4-beta-D-glucanase Y